MKPRLGKVSELPVCVGDLELQPDSLPATSLCRLGPRIAHAAGAKNGLNQSGCINHGLALILRIWNTTVPGCQRPHICGQQVAPAWRRIAPLDYKNILAKVSSYAAVFIRAGITPPLEVGQNAPALPVAETNAPRRWLEVQGATERPAANCQSACCTESASIDYDCKIPLMSKAAPLKLMRKQRNSADAVACTAAMWVCRSHSLSLPLSLAQAKWTTRADCPRQQGLPPQSASRTKTLSIRAPPAFEAILLASATARLMGP